MLEKTGVPKNLETGPRGPDPADSTATEEGKERGKGNCLKRTKSK